MIVLLFITAVFLIGIAVSVYISVLSMSRSPDLMASPESASAIVAAVPSPVADFLQANGFQFDGAYRFHSIRLGIWQHADGPPLHRLCLTRSSAGTSYEFVTDFSDDVSLTTSRSGSAFLFPRTFGGFLQTFPDARVERLWESHIQGAQFLIDHHSVSIAECRLPYEERQKRAVIQQLSYIRSLPFWPFRGIYWFLIKRFLMRNRPIWAQDVAGFYKHHSPAAPGSN